MSVPASRGVMPMPRRPICFPTLEPEYRTPAGLTPILHDSFTFNGETHHLPPPLRWRENPSADVEWHILLHKFYYAPGLAAAWRTTGDARYRQKWIELTSSWIADVEPGFLAADVTGRRIQNWIYAYFEFTAVDAPPLPAGFRAHFLRSLETQVNWLHANLHPRRNHRTLELHALFLAGLMFPGLRGPVPWRDWALDALCENIDTDLLADGVHCELATDYHHIVLRNFLAVRRLCDANGIAFPPAADAVLIRALEFAMHAHKPDGNVPALSDGDARSHRDVLDLGAALYARPDFAWAASGGLRGNPPSSRLGCFPIGGYCFMRSGWGTDEAFAQARYLAFDCGPLGEGNHGHLDALNVELAAHGRSVVVDPGRYTYHEGGDVNWRVQFRRTRAHNTVVVDDLDQTRYEPGPRKFKVKGPAAVARLLACTMRDASGFVSGDVRSDAYDAHHRREIFFPDGRCWLIVDDLFAPGPHTYAQGFQLSEAAEGATRLEQHASCSVVHAPGLVIVAAGGAGCRIEDGHVAYRYGIRHRAPRVVFTRTGARARFTTLLVPYATAEAPRVFLRVASGSAARDEVDVEIRLAGHGWGSTYRCTAGAAASRDDVRRAARILQVEPDGNERSLLDGNDADVTGDAR
ncbi:MAG: heparinase II/III family protein [Gammaproteobacteria bacterium]